MLGGCISCQNGHNQAWPPVGDTSLKGTKISGTQLKRCKQSCQYPKLRLHHISLLHLSGSNCKKACMARAARFKSPPPPPTHLGATLDKSGGWGAGTAEGAPE